MKELAIWFSIPYEDLSGPDDKPIPQRGMPVEAAAVILENVKVPEYRLFEEGFLEGCRVSAGSNALGEYLAEAIREAATSAGISAWVRDYEEPSYRIAWESGAPWSADQKFGYKGHDSIAGEASAAKVRRHKDRAASTAQVAESGAHENVSQVAPVRTVEASKSSKPQNTQSNTFDLASIPWLHLFAQTFEHDDGAVVGNRNALMALRSAIDAALAPSGGAVTREFYVNDGEGFMLRVQCLDEATMKLVALPYTDASSAGHGGISPWDLDRQPEGQETSASEEDRE